MSFKLHFPLPTKLQFPKDPQESNGIVAVYTFKRVKKIEITSL